MNWSNTRSNPWDALTQDQLIVMHLVLKETLDKAKIDEMELRKYIVNRAFPEKQEGTNTIELGNDYQLKATIKYNYKLLDNDTVEKTLDNIAKLGNEGSFIAERLVSWTPNFLITEYRKLVEDAASSHTITAILEEVNKMLVITDAAPTLEVKEPKAKKK